MIEGVSPSFGSLRTSRKGGCFTALTASFAGEASATEGLDTGAKAPFACWGEAAVDDFALAQFESLRGDRGHSAACG